MLYSLASTFLGPARSVAPFNAADAWSVIRRCADRYSVKQVYKITYPTGKIYVGKDSYTEARGTWATRTRISSMPTSRDLVIFTSVCAVLVMMLQVGNIVLSQSFNAFSSGVVFLLLIAALMFIQLLATKLAA